jgi:hypothetical protein
MAMEVTTLLVSRLQRAFTISFHIIFPAFTTGLAARLTVLEGLLRDQSPRADAATVFSDVRCGQRSA